MGAAAERGVAPATLAAMPIRYHVGDATQPVARPALLVHVCNDIGGWGAGFVLALSRRWPEPEVEYRRWHRAGEGFELGAVQFVGVEDDLWVANLIGQRDIRARAGVPPIRYEALEQGLGAVAAKARELGASVHMPRIGCGLAGGSWDRVGALVEAQLAGLDVVVYDLPPRR